MASELFRNLHGLLRHSRHVSPRLRSIFLCKQSKQPTITFLYRSASTQPYYPRLDGTKRGGVVNARYITYGLLSFGFIASCGIIYDFYSSYTAYPQTSEYPIRGKLRIALRAMDSSSYASASESFSEAYELALDLASKGGLGSREAAFMRTTGIAIKWAGMWEEAKEYGKAIEVYQKAWKEVQLLTNKAVENDISSTAAMARTTTTTATHKEVMRGVAIGLKLGDMYQDLGEPDADAQAEGFYSWCVNEMLRLGLTEQQKERVAEEMEHGIVAKAEGLEDKEALDLPSWANNVELVAAFERLGALYFKMGQVEYAQPLLQQAVAILYPPPTKDGPKKPLPSIQHRCHAATLMNNLSSSFVQSPSPTASDIDQASRWARQALSVSNQSRKEAEGSRNQAAVPMNQRVEVECEIVAVIGAYNLGKLSELAGDSKSALAWFEKSKAQSHRIGHREGFVQSTEAIKRLKDKG